jgi:hypothetical protein
MGGEPIDIRDHLRRLVGKTIETITGRPNRILEVRSDVVVVATGRSPQGQPVPIEWIQDALDRLVEQGEIDVSVPSLGYRSAFVGAVLLSLPGARKAFNPARVVLEDPRPNGE